MEYIKLREVCDLKNGFAFKSSDYIEASNVLNCRMSNIRPNANFDAEYNPKYLPEDFSEKYKEYLLKDGDLIIAMTDLANDPKLLGVPTIVDTKGYKMLLNQRVGKLILLDKSKVLESYLKYTLSLPQNKNYFKKFASGGLQINIGKEDILNLEIPYCDVRTQEQIVKVLDKAQDLIDKRKEQIESLDELVKSRFIEMFGNPVNNSKGWKVRRLNDISAEILSGTTPKGGSQVYIEKGIIFLRSQNVWKNKLVLDDVAYIDEETHNSMKKSSLKNRDILITKTGRINTENSSLGRAAMFLGEDDSANINGHVYLIRLKKNIINEFVLFILTIDVYREYIRSVCVGGIDKRQINKEHLEEFPIILPPVELQNEFVGFIKEVDKLKLKIEDSLKQLEDNFNSLMQKAFKGELFN
ncbi:TPA: restriction endonuclease subunit S [Clostridioides difficile]|nr:restriction endonuclease subunit S [Clostridioides difficile]EGT4941657.1 restriction endonuclease subunit S [Clostridioides difficile]HBH3666521.1 restriction endonuclease subunit S [Clostridioides difficile]HDO9657956.1 restriction endonuclease subunit S [Clostridioides difficile]